MSNGRFCRPADGPISSRAGRRNYKGAFNGMHYGVDIAGQFGWNVRAAWNGVVVNVYQVNSNDRRVRIRHQGRLTNYLHLSAVHVRVGQQVRAGDVIGKIGNAGTGPHLHFEVHNGEVWRGTQSANITWVNQLLDGTPTNGSSTYRQASSSSSSSSNSSSSSSSKSSSSSRPGTRSGETPWPSRALNNPFTANGGPFRGKSGSPLNTWFDVVPASHSAALFEAIRRAGYQPTSQTKWGHEELIRQRVRALGYTANDPRSIWRAWQRYLASARGGRRYKGTVDGIPGPQTWWATTEWLNSIRRSY